MSSSTQLPQKFALVHWVADPEPDCWQVIQTLDIIAPSDGSQLEEGKTYDAYWAKDEETSPATVLKLGGKSNEFLGYTRE